jgi:hypothetical protein
MRPELREYITSERFIHDGLLKDGDFLVKRIFALWKKDRRLTPSLILWPSHAIEADSGAHIEDIISVNLPPEEDHKEIIKAAVDRTSAYAFFYVREQEGMVKALLESPHETRSWSIPIKRSADVRVLGKIASQDDKDCLGVLWVPARGRS